MPACLLSCLILAFCSRPEATAQIQTFCTNISGSISCTSYDHGASSQSYCSSIAGALSCTTYADDYSRVQVLKNYEAGQVIGTALGEAVMGAIEQYRANKRRRQTKDDEWNQIVQNAISTEELACEKEPDSPVLGCRSCTFSFNQFIHRHKKDFVVDGKNLGMLADVLDKTPHDDPTGATCTEHDFEIAFQSLDKRQLDKKVYVGEGADRQSWEKY